MSLKKTVSKGCDCEERSSLVNSTRFVHRMVATREIAGSGFRGASKSRTCDLSIISAAL